MSKPENQKTEIPTADLRWVPHPGPQTEFLSLDCFEVLYGGAKGPGKTEALIFEAIRQIEHPRYRGIIFRRTFPRLQEIIDRSHRWYPRLGGTYHSQERRWRFPSGATVAFGHVQHEGDKHDHQGHEFHFMGFDQLEEFTETQYLFLMAQIRATDPALKCYIRATANPGGIGHAWVKRRFLGGREPYRIYEDSFGNTRSFVPATVYDNPTLMQNDPHYVKRLENLPEKDRKALLEGNWDVFEGQFFDLWDSKVHVVQPFEIPKGWRRFLSLDYGYSSPSSVGFWALDYDNRMIRYREIYQERLLYSELAEAILRALRPDEQIAYCVADPSIWDDRQHHWGTVHGESGAETMQKIFGERLRLIRGDNRRIIGWNRLRERLKLYPGPNGKATGGLSVFSTCHHFIRTIPELIHDELHPEDLDTTGEDHAADDTRYAVMSRPYATPAPQKPQLDAYSQAFWDDFRKDLQRLRQPPEDEETWEEINA
jgi:hypothetical protein